MLYLSSRRRETVRNPFDLIAFTDRTMSEDDEDESLSWEGYIAPAGVQGAQGEKAGKVTVRQIQFDVPMVSKKISPAQPYSPKKAPPTEILMLSKDLARRAFRGGIGASLRRRRPWTAPASRCSFDDHACVRVCVRALGCIRLTKCCS